MTASCPHCGEAVDTTAEKLNEPVECPECHNPFEMVIPKSRVDEVRDISGEEAEATGLADEVEERTLLVRHPAMFRAHPFYFTGWMILLAGGIYAVTYGITATTPLAIWAGLALVAVTCCALLVWWLRNLAVTVTVTADRTILQEGFFSRETSEVQHDDVRNIQLDQSMIERILCVGDIGISSSGQDDLEIVARQMPGPDEIVDTIRKNQT